MKKNRSLAQVLVVDDEKDMCWALSKIVQFEGLASLLLFRSGPP